MSECVLFSIHRPGSNDKETNKGKSVNKNNNENAKKDKQHNNKEIKG